MTAGRGQAPGSAATTGGVADNGGVAAAGGGDKLLRRLCGTVLIMEAVVIALAITPAVTLEHVHGPVAGAVGGGLAVLGLLLGGMIGRPRKGWVLAAGSVYQALVIAAGVAVPAMYVLGVIFAALWITGIWLARRLQRPPTTPA